MAKIKPKQKNVLISSEPEYMRLERALFKAKEEMGWKSLTGFLVRWTNENQPSETSYTLNTWLKDH